MEVACQRAGPRAGTPGGGRPFRLRALLDVPSQQKPFANQMLRKNSASGRWLTRRSQHSELGFRLYSTIAARTQTIHWTSDGGAFSNARTSSFPIASGAIFGLNP